MTNFTQAKAELRQRLESLPFNRVIDDEALLSILRCHPKGDIKGCSNGLMKCRHGRDFTLYVRDAAGEIVDNFSWIEALKSHRGLTTGYKDRQHVKVHMAARELVSDQIRKVREFHQIVGRDFEVDHVVPFKSLFDAWLTENKLNVSDIPVTKTGCRVSFTDPSLAESWSRFHQKHAQLRVLSTEEHRRITAATRRAQGAC
jgi:hypothetical protein